MADATQTSHAVHEAPTGFIRKWIFSTDHKVIGIQYFFLALFSVLLGMFLSIFIRFNLVWPGTEIPLLETFFPVGAPRRRDDAGILSFLLNPCTGPSWFSLS